MSYNIAIITISLIIFLLLLLIRKKYIKSSRLADKSKKSIHNMVAKDHETKLKDSLFNDKDKEKQEIRIARLQHKKQLQSKKLQIVMAILASVIFLLITIHQMFFQQ